MEYQQDRARLIEQLDRLEAQVDAWFMETCAEAGAEKSDHAARLARISYTLSRIRQDAKQRKIVTPQII